MSDMSESNCLVYLSVVDGKKNVVTNCSDAQMKDLCTHAASKHAPRIQKMQSLITALLYGMI